MKAWADWLSRAALPHFRPVKTIRHASKLMSSEKEAWHYSQKRNNTSVKTHLSLIFRGTCIWNTSVVTTVQSCRVCWDEPPFSLAFSQSEVLCTRKEITSFRKQIGRFIFVLSKKYSTSPKRQQRAVEHLDIAWQTKRQYRATEYPVLSDRPRTLFCVC